MKYIGFEEMKMKKIFTDENEEYGLDCSQAIWASDQLHQIYHDAKVQLSDADFMIENSEKLKSATESRAINLADKLVPYSLGGTALTYLITRPSHLILWKIKR